MKIGYARVSTNDQNIDPQIEILKQAGCEKIFFEKFSGKAMADRPQLEELLNILRPGDEIVVWKLDRLGRSLLDLIHLIKIFESKEVNFKSINDSIDTSTSIGKFVFHLFGALAEYERTLISERTKFGLAAARMRGRKGGRPKGLPEKDEIIATAIKSYYDSGMTMKEISKKVNKSLSTCYRYKNYKI